MNDEHDERVAPETPATAATVADAFARGGAVRERAERCRPAPDVPERIRRMLLSNDPEVRRSGRRLAHLDHQDGGAAGRRLTPVERARFMAS